MSDTKVCAFLLDIEGTTTPISFVKEVLFPYARANVAQYLKENWLTEELQDDVVLLVKQNEIDIQNGESAKPIPDLSIATASEIPQIQQAIIDYVLWQMDSDRKTTSLKQLQGHIWKSGYTSGVIKALLYDDVMPAIEQWVREKRKVYIYSSGSVEAQKLLFEYTDHGNLLQFISGYYDTKIGAKTQCESYKSIANSLKLEPSSVLFLTDVPAEARAAKEAGMKSTIVVREGNAPLSDDDKNMFQIVYSLSSVDD